MTLSIGEASRLLGISVRTLHYYDEIGLLSPSRVSEAGYRFYDDRCIEELRRILFLRELDFPLDEIKTILSNPVCDKTGMLINHRDLLRLKRQRLDEMIKQLDETIGGMNVSKQKITAADITAAKEKYAAEVRERWGGTAAYAESEQKRKTQTVQQQADAAGEAKNIFDAFAEIRSTAPESEAAQELVALWQAHITKNHYACTKEILACLGEMYTADERFRENIDQSGEGTAEFMSKAIKAYCSK